MKKFTQLNIATLLLVSFFLAACSDNGVVVFDDGQQKVIFNPDVDRVPKSDAHEVCLNPTVQKPTAIIMKNCYMDALSGNAQSQWIIGMSYSKGNILPNNDEKSKYWLKKAAKQKHIGSALMLATLYGKNAGNYNDLFYAFFWYTVIPEMSPHNEQEAEWISLAKENKATLLNSLSRPLTPKELKDLDKAIKNYKGEVFR